MYLMCKMAQRTMRKMNTPEQEEGQPKANVEKIELIDQNAIKSDDIPIEKKKAQTNGKWVFCAIKQRIVWREEIPADPEA